MPGDRCQYEHAGSVRSGVGSTCCWRPTWRDHNRCVWYIQAAGLSQKAFESQRPEPGERLDGIQLQEVSLVNVDWFEECILINGEFTDVDLQGTSFARANLRETTFDSVNLSKADLSATDLEGTLLRNVDLRNATLDAARIENIRFSNVKVDARTAFGGDVCV